LIRGDFLALSGEEGEEVDGDEAMGDIDCDLRLIMMRTILTMLNDDDFERCLKSR
jgi:hypothetical protein